LARGAGASHGGIPGHSHSKPVPGSTFPADLFANAVRQTTQERKLPRAGWWTEVKRDQLLIM